MKKIVLLLTLVSINMSYANDADNTLIEPRQSMPIINEAALEKANGSADEFLRITKPDYVEKAYVPKENPLFTELDKAEQTKDRNIWEDSFRLNNSVGSAWNYFSEPDYKGQNGYSAYEMDKDLLQGLSLDEYKDVIDSRSHEELVGRLTRIHDENMTRKHISESGFKGVAASGLMRLFDPINIILLYCVIKCIILLIDKLKKYFKSNKKSPWRYM